MRLKRREDAPEIGDIQQLTLSGNFSTVSGFIASDYQSVYISGAARVNGRALCQALVNAAKKHGALFINGSAELKHTDNEVTGVRVEDKQYAADCVVVTAGAWAAELLAPLGVNLQLTAKKHKSFILS